MVQKRIKIKQNYCFGCRNCEQMCSYVHTGEFNPRRSRIRIISDISKGVDSPSVCRQCKNSPCKDVCSEDAFKLNSFGMYYIDADLCINCGLCIKECPHNAIFVDEVLGVAIKCDLCNGNPQCVKICRKLPFHDYKAISFEKKVKIEFMPGIVNESAEWKTIELDTFTGEDIDELFLQVIKVSAHLRLFLLNENGRAHDSLNILVNNAPVSNTYKDIKNEDLITVMLPLSGG